MPARVIALGLALICSACEVEVSLGRDDAGLDAQPSDAAACAAHDASVCGVCMAASCCAALTACEATATCPCIVACVQAGDGDAAMCSTHCGPDGDEHAALLLCAHDFCTPSCP